MKMVGQKNLIQKLNIATLDSMPRSLILVGPSGCGKHLYASEVAEKLKLKLLDITDNLNLEYLVELKSKVEPFIYIIDSSKISLREQNIILKFLEEPLKNSYIFLLCENQASLIETVWNRCQRWYFESYSEEELIPFCDDCKVRAIFRTPGKLLEVKDADVFSILELCDKIIEKINIASLPNTLTLANNMAFKEEKDKININLFKDIFIYSITQKIIQNNSPVLFKMYDVIKNYIYKSNLPKMDQRMLYDNMLINLWEASRSGT